jgi:hypothetical protein
LGGVDTDNPLAQLLSSDWLHYATIQYEIVLGFWLMSGVNRPAAWVVGVATFAVFSLLTFWSGWVGRASCGCFGDIHVSPWYAFALDIAALAALVGVARPARAERAVALSGSAAFAGGVGFVAAAWTAVALGFGSTNLALAALRGEPAAATASTLDFGSVAAGDSVTQSATIYNTSADQLWIVGGTADCSCTTLNDLPVMVPPGESRAVSIRVRFPAEPGRVERRCTLWTNSPTRDVIELTLHGRCVGPSP